MEVDEEALSIRKSYGLEIAREEGGRHCARRGHVRHHLLVAGNCEEPTPLIGEVLRKGGPTRVGEEEKERIGQRSRSERRSRSRA